MSDRRGNRAALPVDDHRRAPTLSPDGLQVWHVEENGVAKRRYDFDTLGCAEGIKRQLAEEFARRCGPEGTWRTLYSSLELWNLLTTFTRFLAEQEPEPRELAEISPAIWAAWRIGRAANTTGKRQISKIASFLRDHPQVPEATREAMYKRNRKDQAHETSYSAEQFEKVKTETTRIFRAALLRIQGNVRHLEAWREGRFQEGSRDYLIGEALDCLMRTGEVPTYVAFDPDGRRRIRVVSRYGLALGGINAEHTWMRLFMTTREAAALIALIVCTYGWNATPIGELTVPRATPDAGIDGQVIYRVELEKRRRMQPLRYETRNLTDWGAASPGRLIAQAVEATAPARAVLDALGEPRDRLIVWRSAQRAETGPEMFRSGFGDDLLHNTRTTLLEGERLNLRRLRKTAIVAHLRTPTQHSQKTHDQVYVLPDPRTREQAAKVISDGVAGAIDNARTTLRARITRAQTQAATDTATSGCTDYEHSPFSAHGVGCRASFLLCTACPNAVISPRHLPRLAYLHQALDALRGVLPTTVWEADWSEPFARLSALKAAPEFTEAEWRDAKDAVTQPDREVIDQLLRKGFDA